MRTSATSSTSTGSPSAESFTTALPISAGSVVEVTPRTIYSLPYSYSTPPAVFWVISCTEAVSSSTLTPNCFIFRGDISIWYSLTSPPITETCATPDMESSRGRIVQSASVRRSRSDVLSEVRPTIISSPRMEDWGPSTGVPTPGGSVPESAASFSVTIWRAI